MQEPSDDKLPMEQNIQQANQQSSNADNNQLQEKRTFNTQSQGIQPHRIIIPHRYPRVSTKSRTQTPRNCMS